MVCPSSPSSQPEVPGLNSSSLVDFPPPGGREHASPQGLRISTYSEVLTSSQGQRDCSESKHLPLTMGT